jgi:spore cortex biosynthesis protein YabQ
MMTAAAAAQTQALLLSCALGACMGLLYDVIRILRSVRRRPAAAVFAQDILFALICLCAASVFILRVSPGGARAYLLAGMALGAALYFLLLSGAVMKPAAAAAAACARTNARLRAAAGLRIDSGREKARKIFKKEDKLVKTRLHVLRDMMYNLKCIKSVRMKKRCGAQAVSTARRGRWHDAEKTPQKSHS